MKSFEEIFHEFYDEERGDATENYNIYVRDVTACLRKKWYARKIRKPFSPSTYGIFELGNIVEDKVAEVLEWADEKKYITLKRREKPMVYVEDDFVLSGRLDFLIRVDGENYVIECKSKSGFSFRKYLNEPKQAHIEQLNTYLKAPWADKGFVLYASKGNLMPKVFPHTFDEDMFKKTMKKAQYLAKCLETDTLPMRKYENMDGRECNYCSYKEECKSNLSKKADDVKTFTE